MDARRLLAALAASALLIGLLTYAVYDNDVAQSAVAVGGLAILLALAVGVAWASERKRVGR